MKRNVSLEEISDGKLYTSNDMVKADCGDCQGCSACCHGMGDVDSTRTKRIAALTEFESKCPDEPLSPYDQLSFESIHYGSPISVFPDCRQTYVVMAVETKYSPKVSLYSAATGKSGTIKIKKDTFKSQPLDVGDVIIVGKYDKRPRYTYIDGKSVPIPGTKELWVQEYVVALHHDEVTTAKEA